MVHGKPLRVIGQSLEIARVTEFAVENDGRDYLGVCPRNHFFLEQTRRDP